MKDKELKDKIVYLNRTIINIGERIKNLDHEMDSWIKEKKKIELLLVVNGNTCSVENCIYKGFKGDCIREAFGFNKNDYPEWCTKHINVIKGKENE